MYGAAQDEVPTRKSSKFVPDFPLTGMGTRCDKTHAHQQLRGSAPSGSRTAMAARYPPKLCNAILDNITASRSTPQDGGRRLPSAHVFLDPPGFGDWSKADPVAHRIHDLRAVARHLGHQLALTGHQQLAWALPLISSSVPTKLREPVLVMLGYKS